MLRRIGWYVSRFARSLLAYELPDGRLKYVVFKATKPG